MVYGSLRGSLSRSKNKGRTHSVIRERMKLLGIAIGSAIGGYFLFYALFNMFK